MSAGRETRTAGPGKLPPPKQGRGGTGWGLLAGLAMLPVSVTAASYTDYARVVATEPLYERVRVSLPAEDCSRGDDRRPTGWVSPERFGGSLAEHLRFEIASRREASAAARCSKWTEQQEIERVRGYRVWYEYRGQTLVQELPAPPGPRIPVVVDLEPE